MRTIAAVMGAAVILASCGEAAAPDNRTVAAPAPSPEQARAALDAAVENPARGDMTAVDARRHGREILAFSGIGPGDKAIDLIPGAGYWTKLLSLTVGPTGKVYGIWPEPYARVAKTNVTEYANLKATPNFANTVVSVQPVTTLKTPEPVDLVFTSQNFHDYADPFMGSPGVSVFAKAAFDALKPGGVLVVIDHAAESGSGLRDTDTLHRIDPATVKAEAAKAGFVFDGELGVLANPADDHKKDVFDASIRGRTDQFVYRFRKPD